MRTSSRRIAPLATILTGLGAGVVALAPAAHADTSTVTYLFTGAEQTFVVPDGVTRLSVTLVGGRGGGNTSRFYGGPYAGGFGAIQTGTVRVTPLQTVYVEVGGNGQDGSDTNVAGGFDGGGAGGSLMGAGGGGASDVRTVASGDPNSLDSVLLMAAGGGGAATGSPGGSSGGQIGSPGGAANGQCPDPGHPGGGGGPGSAGSGGNPPSDNGAAGNGADGGIGVGGAGGRSSSGSLDGGGGGGGGNPGGGGGGGGTICGGGGGAGASYVISTGAAHQDSAGPDTSGRSRITITYVVPLAPQATTEPASAIGTAGATLNGVVNPESSDTTYWFEWGTSTAYDGSTSHVGGGSGSADEAESAGLSGLEPDTEYHFRLVAVNANGTTQGADQSFTTSPLPPTPAPQATTQPASAIGSTTATLNGVINPEGTDTQYVFAYGTTTSYTTGTFLFDAGSGTGQVAVPVGITGLSPGTTYHFQLSAYSAGGSADGGDLTFRTASSAPLTVTQPASQIGQTTARLNGQVNADGAATTYRFQYGRSTAYGRTTTQRSAGSGTSLQGVTASLSGLARHTLYHFRLVAVNANGTTYGVDRTFRTG